MRLEDARVVDQDVDRAKRLVDLVDHPLDSVGVRQISANDNVTLAGQPGRDVKRLLAPPAVVDRNSVTQVGERLRGRSADPARGSRHEHAPRAPSGHGRDSRHTRGRRAAAWS